MQKPTSLRNALLDAIPTLNLNQDKLQVTVGQGSVVATLATSLSYEKHYPLTVSVTGFIKDINVLLVPIMVWLRENQPDIFTANPQGIVWQSADSAAIAGQDITITLLLTERTEVKEVEGQLQATDLPEPQPEAPVTRPLELYINGELVSQWSGNE